MRLFELALLAATASTVAAQAVTSVLKPSAANPPGCRQSMPGSFNIFKSELKSASKRDTASAAEANALQVYLNNTVLTDSAGRTGAIVANFQFQFDGPPQAGSLYTAGFCLLPNNSLVLGNTAVWWSCNSGGFDNLYDRWWAAQCRPVLLNAFNTNDSTSTASGASASTTSSHSGVLTSTSTGNATAASALSAASASSKITTTTGTVTKQSTAPAPTATSSHAAAPTGSRIGGMAIAAGLLGVVML